MPNYKKMYFALYDAVTTAIDQLQNAQREGEGTYIESDDFPLVVSLNQADEKQRADG
ncbi:MAG: hypothetical protein ACOX88_06965 [Christensenellales bacterium]